jgi:hypothetical protein
VSAGPAPFEDCNGPLLKGDGLLDRPYAPLPGWFAAIEADLVAPHIKNRLSADVNVGGLFTDTVHLPTAELDFVGAPRFELGYRFPEGCGEVLVSYQPLVSDGSATISNFDPLGDGDVRSRLNMNVVDFDYGSREFSLGPSWDLRWLAGVRVAGVYFDSRAEGAILEQRTSNNFVGAGPHLGLELGWHAGYPGLSIFGRLEGAAVIGEVRQGFEETLSANGIPVVGGATTVTSTQAVPVLRFQTGVGWAPPCNGRWLRFSAGYIIEHWWDVGQAGGSQAELGFQGLFLRSEFSF